jgi:hypothetical protein
MGEYGEGHAPWTQPRPPVYIAGGGTGGGMSMGVAPKGCRGTVTPGRRGGWGPFRRFCCRAQFAFVVTLSLAAAVAAEAPDWVPELAPPEREFRGPTDPIRIFIPPHVPVETLANLALELNHIDVTQSVTREEDYAVFVPYQPLQPGEYTLRLVEYTPDGGILERAVWILEVRKSAGFGEAEVAGQVDAVLAQRIHEDETTGLPERTTGQGSAQVAGRLADAGWRVDGTANFIFNSQSEQTFRGENFDLGQYLVAGSAAGEDLYGEVKLGHHDIGVQSLIMQGFNRRGLSAKAAMQSGLADVTGFMMRTEDIVGFPHITGVSHSDDRVEGVTVAAHPFQGRPEDLALTATYLTGDGNDIGVGVAGDTTPATGDGASVTADSLLLGQRLRLHGEFAVTRFDADGEGGFLGRQGDHAYTLLATFAPIDNKVVGDEAMTWSLGAGYQRVGTFFFSLANPALPADKRTLRLFSELGWGGLTVAAEAGRETDNVEGKERLPRVETDQAFLSATYSPIEAPDSEGALAWLGHPSVGLTTRVQRQEQISNPPGFAGLPTDNRTYFLQGNVGSSYESWGWNVAHAVTLFEDDTGGTPDTLNNLTDVSTHFNVAERVYLVPYLQWNTIDDRDGVDDITNVNLGVDAEAVLIQETLVATLNYSVNLIDSLTDETDTQTLGGELLWTILPSEINRPGIGLSLSGNYQEIDNSGDPGVDESQYQVFAALKVSMPVKY